MKKTALLPQFVTRYADEPVRLYQGRLSIRQGTSSAEGDGTLDVVWRSRPKLRFDVPSLTPAELLRAENCTLAIPHLNAEASAHLSDVRFSCDENGESTAACGQLDRNITIGREEETHQVIFHVVNFWPYLNPRTDDAPRDYDIGRVTFAGGGWRVTLQSVPELAKLEASLRRDSGCGITHVGRAERLDGSPTSRQEASDLFDGLCLFLSFARGMWSPTILYDGFDKVGTLVWRDWNVRRASPWRAVLSWFPEHEPQCMAAMFPGFMRLWLDPDCRDIVKVAIHWYVEANLGSGATEGAVILSQNGLERLAYYILVHERGKLVEQDFRPGGLPAAERLRNLFSEFGLSLEIGSPRLRVKELPSLAASQRWKDAPDALVGLRNSIVHPDRRNMQRLEAYPLAARREALTLYLWYFELVLLKWFGYSGNYANRQTIQACGETESVPQ